MVDEIFLLTLSWGILLLFVWAFRTLPAEGWQILACLPGRKRPDGTWNGINLTYYGLFNALAYVIAVAIFMLIIGSLGIAPSAALTVILPILVIGMGASRYIARLVEKKPSTFSVGAASFVGIVIAPWTILLVNMTLGKWWLFHFPMLETLAAMLIAYAFGEGIGRLACISFGCCYGKPLSECHALIQKIFRRRHFVFQGRIKKIHYADRLEGRPVVPVQALTAVLYTGAGILSFYLFLKGFSSAALLLVLLVTQSWRFVSEFLRADYRGQSRVSAYQIMSLLAMGYILILMFAYAQPQRVAPALMKGFQLLWDPGLIIFLLVLGIVSFVYAGKSEVTNCTIDIHVVEKKT
ncbi:MAG: prolipoprotein diacylglyceryl transferase [Deltaproteobacteria bacterium HGW-Deltaproteobacteria-1]|jgi:hypothetical protein|nr:MAG: prolipoprotein diacylglyceryl transferase [Deltaproteobacteria bacterium HGW-Deltaproteobacteria-1]